VRTLELEVSVDYPYQARTNKDTHLIILGGDNIAVRAGTSITVYGEDGSFGTVSVNVNGQDKFGSMLRAAYS
jgi:VCBS repeat-containing protein